MADDARAETDHGRELAELTRRTEQLWSDLINEDDEGAVGILRQYVAAMDHIGEQWAATAARPADPNPNPATVAHNHTRFRNDGGPWSPCPVSCPAAGLLR